LHLDRAVDTPAEASGAKFFSHGESARAGAIVRVKVHASDERQAHFLCAIKKYDIAKIGIPSVLLHREQIFIRNRVNEKFFGSKFCRRSRRRCGGAGGRGAYTQN
jgi:hypothetical protein